VRYSTRKLKEIWKNAYLTNPKSEAERKLYQMYIASSQGVKMEKRDINKMIKEAI
jgi:hypothetical protein